MTVDRSDASGLEKAWREALEEYTREVKNTLELLASASRPATIEQQRQAERKAFDKYRKARRAYLDFIQGVGGIAIALGIHALPLTALSAFFGVSAR